MNFANPEINRLASKPMVFENWMEFRNEFLKVPVLPACYDLPSFIDKSDFSVRLPKILLERILLGIERGRSFNVGVAVSALTSWISRIGTGVNMTIGDFLDLFPMFILV